MKYVDWVAQKQINKEYPTIHLYIEQLKTSSLSEEKVQEMIRQSFSSNFSDYTDMKEMLNVEPVSITLLSEGAFAAYMK